jgi:hypothetical protein
VATAKPAASTVKPADITMDARAPDEPALLVPAEDPQVRSQVMPMDEKADFAEAMEASSCVLMLASVQHLSG